jgi:hypothetical protein
MKKQKQSKNTVNGPCTDIRAIKTDQLNFGEGQIMANGSTLNAQINEKQRNHKYTVEIMLNCIHIILQLQIYFL